MKLLLKIIGGVVAVFAVVILLQFVASETGEVVVVTTTDAEGVTHETRLWVVEHDGAQYLRSGAPGSAWYKRLVANPEINVERNGVEATYQALPQPDLRDTINDLVSEKYGWADAYIGVLFGRDDAIPIRLQP